jgi:23S rRNA pseudouridine1911/1915/1917 synthase
MRIDIIHEDDDILVIDKPAGLPSAPLKRAPCQNRPAPTALEQAAELFPVIRAVAGYAEWEFGLIHRLDTATRGLLLIAKNQQTFDFLRQEPANGKITKHYSAFCVRSETALPNSPPLPYPLALQLERLFAGQSNTEELVCASRFRPWGKGGKEVRPFVDPQTNGDVQCAQKKKLMRKKNPAKMNMKLHC